MYQIEDQVDRVSDRRSSIDRVSDRGPNRQGIRSRTKVSVRSVPIMEYQVDRVLGRGSSRQGIGWVCLANNTGTAKYNWLTVTAKSTYISDVLFLYAGLIYLCLFPMQP